MFTPEGDLVVVGEGGVGMIVLKKPTECRRCHRIAALLVNRMGKTLCVDCDGQTPEGKEAKQRG